MSTPGVTPDLLLLVAAAWEGGTARDDYVRSQLRAWADRLERESKPLPTEPGWYPSIVVERGGESCTGALLTEDGYWETPRRVRKRRTHNPGFASEAGLTIRWAEQDGKTPGQTLWEAPTIHGTIPGWHLAKPALRERWERRAAAVLAAHGTPTLTDDDLSKEFHQGWLAGIDSVKPASLVLTPVDEHPEPGTRGLLPVVVEGGALHTAFGVFLGHLDSGIGTIILADPRPDGAQ